MTQKPVFMEGLFTLRNLRSMGAAVIVEVLLAAGIAALLIWQQLRPETTLPPPIVDPISHFTEQTLPQPHEKTVPEPQSPKALPLHAVTPVPTDLPGADVQPLKTPWDRPVSDAGTPGSGDILARFEAQMTAAIDAAKVYPKIAILQAKQGVVTVSFDYIGGVVSDVRVETSSGSPAIDASAMRAVQKAALPPKPAEAAGQTHFAVTLDYTLGG